MPSSVAITGATFAATQPVSILPAPNGMIYAVNGLGRGYASFRGAAAHRIGMAAAATVAVTTAGSTLFHYVSSVEVRSGGQNYFSKPKVQITGVTKPSAVLAGAEVGRVVFTASATTHTRPPAVTFTGGQASGAEAKAIMRGQVASVNVGVGGWYDEPPDVSFAAAAGVTVIRQAQARAVLSYTGLRGQVASVIVTDGGEYLSDSVVQPITASLEPAALGSPPALRPDFSATLDSVAITTGGTNYTSAPTVSISPLQPKRQGGGAAAVVGVSDGSVTGATVLRFGSGYDGRVDVKLTNAVAKAVAVITPRLLGTYLCGVRYVDANGVPGNLCSLVEVNCDDGASSLDWTIPSPTESRATRVELWRTSADQAITLYRVANLSAGTNSYADSLPDNMLLDESRAGYAELPILTPDGYPNAYRFGIPPGNFSTICMFADRAWYAVDETGAEPRTLYFSEAGEPESVPPEYQVVLQTSGRESDRITGLIPMDGALYVCQQRSITRLTVGGHPLESASATPVLERGLLNDRCWDKYDGVAYIADSLGLYSFDGNSAKPLSDPIKNLWLSTVDFGFKSVFYFVRVHPAEQVVRFYYAPEGVAGNYPKHALCYSLITQAWWTESYAGEIRCAVAIDTMAGPALLAGTGSAICKLGSGLTDNGNAIAYSLKTGNMALNNDPKRGVRLKYTPTAASHTLGVELHYNGDDTPRPNAIQTNTGSGFVTTTGGTQASLELSYGRSGLGKASGFAQFTLAGRLDDKSAGADRSLAVRLSGVQSSSSPVIHSIQIEGVG